MNCGNVLADIWRYYERRTRELRGGQSATLLILDETKLHKTPEGEVLNELGLSSQSRSLPRARAKRQSTSETRL
jgi:DNA-directed RNA polymerase subunit N (RpoN/RPB10)